MALDLNKLTSTTWEDISQFICWEFINIHRQPLPQYGDDRENEMTAFFRNLVDRMRQRDKMSSTEAITYFVQGLKGIKDQKDVNNVLHLGSSIKNNFPEFKVLIQEAIKEIEEIQSSPMFRDLFAALAKRVSSQALQLMPTPQILIESAKWEEQQAEEAELAKICLQKAKEQICLEDVQEILELLEKEVETFDTTDILAFCDTEELAKKNAERAVCPEEQDSNSGLSASGSSCKLVEEALTSGESQSFFVDVETIEDNHDIHTAPIERDDELVSLPDVSSSSENGQSSQCASNEVRVSANGEELDSESLEVVFEEVQRNTLEEEVQVIASTAIDDHQEQDSESEVLSLNSVSPPQNLTASQPNQNLRGSRESYKGDTNYSSDREDSPLPYFVHIVTPEHDSNEDSDCSNPVPPMKFFYLDEVFGEDYMEEFACKINYTDSQDLCNNLLPGLPANAGTYRGPRRIFKATVRNQRDTVTGPNTNKQNNPNRPNTKKASKKQSKANWNTHQKRHKQRNIQTYFSPGDDFILTRAQNRKKNQPEITNNQNVEPVEDLDQTSDDIVAPNGARSRARISSSEEDNLIPDATRASPPMTKRICIRHGDSPFTFSSSDNGLDFVPYAQMRAQNGERAGRPLREKFRTKP